MVDAVLVEGFVVAPAVVHVAKDQRWTSYTAVSRVGADLVESVFGEQPDASWRFYTVEEMRGMTADWHREVDPSWFGVSPDNIDPLCSVLIGELGPDRPFAIDFRSKQPEVRFMTIDARWVVVAQSPEALLCALGIEAVGPSS